MAEDGVYEDVALGVAMNPQEAAGLVERSHLLSSDYRLEWINTVQDGRSYATEWFLSGTNDGPNAVLGLEATGKPWRVQGASVGVLDDDGQIKLHRDYWSIMSLLRQLGAIPGPPTAS